MERKKYPSPVYHIANLKGADMEHYRRCFSAYQAQNPVKRQSFDTVKEWQDNGVSIHLDWAELSKLSE